MLTVKSWSLKRAISILNWAVQAIFGSLLKLEAIENSIVDVWADESKPIWIPPSENSRPSTSPATIDFLSQHACLFNKESSTKGSGERRISHQESRRASGVLSRNEPGPHWQDSGVITRRESRLGSRPPSRRPSTRDSMIPTRRVTISSRTTILRPGGGGVSVVGNDPKRFTLGFNRESQIVSSSNGCMKSRDELLKVAMSRRTKRAYQLAEQTCRYKFNRSSSTNIIRILDWQRFSLNARISLPMSLMMKDLSGQNRNRYISVIRWNQISKSFRRFLQKSTLDQESKLFQFSRSCFNDSPSRDYLISLYLNSKRWNH